MIVFQTIQLTLKKSCHIHLWKTTKTSMWSSFWRLIKLKYLAKHTRASQVWLNQAFKYLRVSNKLFLFYSNYRSKLNLYTTVLRAEAKIPEESVKPKMKKATPKIGFNFSTWKQYSMVKSFLICAKNEQNNLLSGYGTINSLGIWKTENFFLLKDNLAYM